jgi:hypothetical protein
VAAVPHIPCKEKMVERIFKGFSSTDFRQSFTVWYNQPVVVNGKRFLDKSVLVGVNERGLRIRYPRGTKSKLIYLKEATNDLKSLAALCIVELVPGGIFADKLQEEFPEHEEAANIIRDWFLHKASK